MNQGEPLKSFTQLNAWQNGHKLVLRVYKLVKFFPKEETYALSDQMRRCVISITSNIAEGFSRKSYREKSQFYSIALGSTTELQNQLLVAKDVGYLSLEDFKEIAEQSVVVNKLINGLIKASKSHDS